MKSLLRRVILFGLRRPVLAAFLSLLALALAVLPILAASFSADITRMLPTGSKSERACAVLLNSGLFNQSSRVAVSLYPHLRNRAIEASLPSGTRA